MRNPCFYVGDVKCILVIHFYSRFFFYDIVIKLQSASIEILLTKQYQINVGR